MHTAAHALVGNRSSPLSFYAYEIVTRLDVRWKLHNAVYSVPRNNTNKDRGKIYFFALVALSQRMNPRVIVSAPTPHSHISQQRCESAEKE